VAIDGPVVDINMFAIGRVDELIAVLDQPRPVGERFDEQEFRHRQVDQIAAPGAFVARRVEHEIAALDDLLAAFAGRTAW